MYVSTMDVEIIFIASKILKTIELIHTYFNYVTETETACERKLDMSIICTLR